jgi:hypothetical protein
VTRTGQNHPRASHAEDRPSRLVRKFQICLARIPFRVVSLFWCLPHSGFHSFLRTPHIAVGIHIFDGSERID